MTNLKKHSGIKQLLSFFLIYFSLGLNAQEGNIIDHTCTDILRIPTNWIDSAKATLNIRYGHTSHGNQITNGGMQALVNYSEEYKELFAWGDELSENSLYLIETEDDLSGGDWESEGRAYLAEHPECNVMIWAWCSIYNKDVDDYIARMEALIAEFGEGGSAGREVPVQFVFMTGHTAANDYNESVYNNNRKIRQHCASNNRFLFDFYDIECFNPDGEYFGDGGPDSSYLGHHNLNDDMHYTRDDGERSNWVLEWMAANPYTMLAKLSADDICEVCDHSDGQAPGDDNARLHCVLKGRAAWWLWARLSGWEGIASEPVNYNSATEFDQFSIFPNPTENTFKVLISDDFIPERLSIIDIDGNLIYTRSDFDSTEYSFSNYPTGIYFVNLQSATSFVSKKVIVNKK